MIPHEGQAKRNINQQEYKRYPPADHPKTGTHVFATENF